MKSKSGELNYLRTNYRFEKITRFHCLNFKKHHTIPKKNGVYTGCLQKNVDLF